MPPFRTRAPAVLLAAMLGLTLLVGGQALLGRPADASIQTVRALERSGEATIKQAGRGRERGLRFRPVGASRVTGLRYYRVPGDSSPHVARLWSPTGRELARVTFARSKRSGWVTLALPQAVGVAARPHVVSFSSPAGVPYAVDRRRGADPRSYRVLGGAIGPIGERPARAIRATFRVRPVIAAAQPPSSFPDASNTGVPDGARLAPYNGPTVITKPGTVINGRQVSTYLTIEAEGVVITNSYVDGNIAIAADGGSVSITDSTVDGGQFNGSAVGQYNITMRRVEVIGARQSVSCNQNCDIQDSWLHAQYMEPGSDWHGDGFISNGGRNMVVRHNTLACDSVSTADGGCTAAVALFGDFDALSRITVDGNFFAASPSAYCLYGGHDPGKPYGDESTYIVITNNVFQRGANRSCASFGPVTAIANGGEGNLFEANVWDDGRRVRAP